MDRRVLILGLAVLLLAAGAGAAKIDAKLFTSEDCGPCEKELEFLESLKSEYPRLRITDYDIRYTQVRELYGNLSEELGFPRVVPVLVVGKDYYAGFDSPEKAGKNVRVIIDQASKRLPPEPEGNLTFMLFASPGCPHCQREKEEFIPYIKEKYPGLKVEVYDVGEQEGLEKLKEVSQRLGFSPGSVPVSVVDGEHYIGYGSLETTGRLLEGMVERAYSGEAGGENRTSGSVIELPFLGRVDMEEMMGDMGIPASTMVLGLLDGFNPCAFFVLTMLLSFLVYANSRKRMLLIGLTFVFVSGFVYFLFMTALFSVIVAINEIRLVALAGGLIALTIGIINVKDFFFFRKGVSLSVPEDKKPELYKRMRGLLKKETALELLIGTIILAFVANSYELLCTAGIPLVYSNLLNAQQLDMITNVLYIILYNAFYVMPLLVIVLMFIKGLAGKKMTEERGRLLKAISGFMMLGFGMFLIIDPMILSNILVTGSLIALAIIISLGLSKVRKRRESGEAGEADEGKSPGEREGSEKDASEDKDNKDGEENESAEGP